MAFSLPRVEWNSSDATWEGEGEEGREREGREGGEQGEGGRGGKEREGEGRGGKGREGEGRGGKGREGEAREGWEERRREEVREVGEGRKICVYLMSAVYQAYLPN